MRTREEQDRIDELEREVQSNLRRLHEMRIEALIGQRSRKKKSKKRSRKK